MITLPDLADIGQIVGAVGVVISLFYVGYQIRQNTKAVQSSAPQTVHEHFAKRYQSVAANETDLMQRTPHPGAKPLGAFNIGRKQVS